MSTYKDRLLHALKYDPEQFEIESSEYSFVCHDYISVQKVVWAEMTGQDVEDSHVKAMIRVLTDLPASSRDLWIITDNLEYCAPLKRFMDRVAQITNYIANQRLWRVALKVDPVEPVDPVLLSEFEAFYEKTRDQTTDRHFRTASGSKLFTVSMRDLPVDMARKINAAKVVYDRDNFVRGQVEGIEGVLFKFSFDEFERSFREMRTPTIRFEKANQ